MHALVCPSCHSKLKAPSHLAGRTATCPRCRTAVQVPGQTHPIRLSLEDPRPAAGKPAAPSADTAESRALDVTAEQPALPAVREPAPARERTRKRRWTPLLRIAVLVALAGAGGFAAWMAVEGGSRHENHHSRAPQPQR